MPDPGEYLDGYNLRQNMVISGYQLAKVDINHVQVKLWNEYSYPTTLVFNWVGTGSQHATEADMTTFLQTFTKQIDGYKIIRSESGRPYKCIFMWPIGTPGKYTTGTEPESEYDHITLEYTGRAKRVAEVEAQTIISGGAGKQWV
jgi:hypothetical protein